MSIRNKLESGDLHSKQYKYARIKGRGCSHHCQCKWCIDNRTYRKKQQCPVDEFGKPIMN